MTGEESTTSIGSPDAALACGVCGGSSLVAVLEARRVGGGTATLARCPACGLVQASPLPSETELAKYYHTYAYDAEKTWDTPPAVVHSLTALLTELQPYRGAGRLLDIGCGTGQILRVARGLGWDAHGTELSDLAVRRLREEGFPIAHPDDEAALPAGSFDVVTLAEVLEHVRDPLAVAQRAFRLLRPGGVFYLTTPNFNALTRRFLGAGWRAIQVPEHLFYFTPASVRPLLTRAGFEELWLRTEGINPVDIVRGMRRREAPAGAGASGGNSTAVLRDAAHQHRLIGLVKRAVNVALRLCRAGDTLKVLSRKPSA